MFYSSCYYLLLWICVASAFNIDLNSKIVHQASSQSWFGYDVDIYQDAQDTWILVGAPKAQTSQPGVRRGGAVFRCSTETASCGEIQFDPNGDTKRLNGSELVQIDSKSDQWFGATVATSKNGQAVLACAPRYIYFYSTFDKREPVGTCYLATDGFESITEYSPCRLETYRNQRTYGYHRLGYCMAGFSAALSDEADKLFLGAPGAWYSQGSVVVQNTDEGQNRVLTEEGPAHNDDTYMGYATAAGDFNGDGVEDAAVSIPRGNNLTGMVAMFDFELNNLQNISGEQEGSYFGASLAVADLNGDGRDDLIVGAPLYIEYSSDKGLIKAKYEVGKVYVYFGHNYRQQEVQTVLGQNEWSRFGYSVAAAGDLNLDGYDDFIVGAPYDGSSRRGAVYVYHGDKDGFHPEHTQLIEAHQVHPSMETFGFSLAGGRDVDGNTYPDIVVGAYKSNQAVLLKTRPVVNVDGTIKVSREVISLNDKVCKDNGKFFPCTKATVCLSYTGNEAPSELKLDLVISVDAEKGLSARAFFTGSDLSKMLVQVDMVKGTKWCEKYELYIKDGIRDKLSPIVIQANYSLAEGLPGSTELRPVIDARQPASVTGTVEIEKECGSDKVCIPDLQVSASVPGDEFVLGTDKNLFLGVKVKNQGEAAFESQFFLNVPAGLEYFDHNTSSTASPIICSPPDEFENLDTTEDYILVCDVGNPLPTGKEVKLSFEFVTGTVDLSKGAIVFNMHVNSTNEEPESTLDDNSKTQAVGIKVEAQISVSGVSRPGEYNYDKDDYVKLRLPATSKRPVWDTETTSSQNSAGDKNLIEHRYQVKNDGPSAVHGAVLKIYWPSYTEDKKHLLYLIDDPITTGNVKCRVKQQKNVNPESLTIVPINRNNNDTDEPYFFAMRKKRQTEPEPEEPQVDEGSIEISKAFRKLIDTLSEAKKLGQGIAYQGGMLNQHVDCNKLNCTEIECDIGQLQDQETVLIRVQSRIWVNTLIDEAFYDATISSVAIAKVTALPYAAEPPVMTTVVSTRVNPTDPRIIRRSIPFWLWLIAILAGITFLILLILLLWRIGFFKRKRPPRGQALLQKPPESEYYGFSGYSSAYAPPSMYSETQHGPRL